MPRTTPNNSGDAQVQPIVDSSAVAKEETTVAPAPRPAADSPTLHELKSKLAELKQEQVDLKEQYKESAQHAKPTVSTPLSDEGLASQASEEEVALA